MRFYGKNLNTHHCIERFWVYGMEMKSFLYLSECDEGTYGLDCKFQCPKCTGKHEKCHHVTGKCVRGKLLFNMYAIEI